MILKNKNSGETYLMSHNVFTAGSGAVNNLMLSGDHIRKIHFQILKQGSQFKLMAMNGTVEINGALLGEHVLDQGDEIKVGGEIFVAEFPQTPPVPAPSENGAMAGNPYERLLEGVIRLLDNPDKRRSSEEILSLGMELMEADGGFLFSVEGGSLSLLCSVPEDNESYSNSAVNAALKNRETLIWSAVDGAAGMASEVSAQSIAHKNIHSILVSPLVNRVSGQIIGLLYLHRKRPDSPFSEPQRKLFAQISQLLGGVLGTNQTQIEQAERIETLKEIKGSGDLVYSSPEMGKVVDSAKRAAVSNVPVLITGETGTGKDVLASFIHNHSTRQGKPFIAVNCGAIPENLIESELFGHEKGAFTGATALQRGLFEQANGGTLFLDEVGELPVLMQVKFLRALQSARIRRVGGNEEVPVDVRIIAATNRDLTAEIREGRFREDLYYRLNLVQLRLPPLRDREGDTLVLATHILKKACASFNMNAAALTRAAEKALLKYTWPGNVRELENKIQKALLNSSSRVIDVESLDLPEDPDRELLSLKAAREQAEAQAINLALSKARGNLTLAASFLGIDRKVLRDIMERLGIKKEDFKGSKE
ncbi:MAG: sigma54 specific transcriptional regulator, Fis family [Fibrobacteres bacterium]|nr:sigma54 specific transcriptional regulator, Fis family [Fibrobacterota bacterium]